jgi:Immunity protein 50
MTSWVDCLSDPRPIRAIFGDSTPLLEGVELAELTSDYDRGFLLLRFSLPEYPETPPRKWADQGMNTVQVHLAVCGLEELTVSGWLWQPADISMTRDGDPVRISIVSGGATAVMTADYVNVLKISAYCSSLRPIPVASWDEAVGALQAVLIRCKSLLPRDDVRNVGELVDAGEPGIALEILCTQLYEYERAVDRESLAALAGVGTYFKLDPHLWTSLVKQ